MDVFIRNKPYTGPVQAIVVDWAGTAVDYGCVGPVAVFIEVFRRRGVSVTIPEARGPMGLMKKDHVRQMCATPSVAAKWRAVWNRQPNEADVEAMYADVEPLLISSVARFADPIPGVIEAVTTLRRQGIRVGSSTGYTGPMMEVLTRAAAEKGYAPDAVVSASDVPAGRPYPWMCYLNALKLQVYPFEAMAKIGDTVADIQEGLNARMWTIGVTRTGNELGLSIEEQSSLDPIELATRLSTITETFRNAGAHFVAESMADCPALIAEINTRLARGERP
jgi:phosphonoacetaldehyde hydrolase